MKNKYLRPTLWLLFIAICGASAVFSGLYLYLSPKLPPVESIRDIHLQTPLRIYSGDNQLLGEFGEKRRTPIALVDTPVDFINAIISAEDNRFYSHPGVDIKGLLRAASQLLQSGSIQTGGSTITMQVARNFFLTRTQTFSRKFNEILLALQIEKELSKEEILELYVNKIYLGNRAYGIEAASQVYYGKTITELNLAQLAMIAGLPKAPSAYNPIANPKRAIVRRNWIIGRMLDLDYIDQERHDEAINSPVTASVYAKSLGLAAPYIAEMARIEALEQLGAIAYTDGFKVYTTVSSALQARAQQAITKGLLTYDLRHGYRGPEQKLPPLSTTSDKTAQSNELNAQSDGLNAQSDDLGASETDYEEWRGALQKIPPASNLIPAAVIGVEQQNLKVLLSSGEQIIITWDNGLSKARPYINENRQGGQPKTASDIVSIGDVIRIREIGDQWHLSQIPKAQAAMVAINPNNGAINALVGGFDFRQSNFNRATQAARQPGSNFKPFIYTAALENGLTPATIINDAPIVFNDARLEGTWRPENASGKFYGPTRLRKALYLSRNLVSIRVLQSIGISNALRNMDRYNFNRRKMPKDLSLALGSYELTPLQVATGYTVFANGGYKVEPYLVDRIENAEGDIIFQARPATVCAECAKLTNDSTAQPATDPDNQKAVTATEADNPDTATEVTETALTETSDSEAGNENKIAEGEELTNNEAPLLIEEPEPLPAAPRVMSKQVAYLIDDMLHDVIKRGTARKALALGRSDLAGKTGTTNGPRDAWFSGYNHSIVATAWVGFDKNTLLGRREYGGTAALPIWMDFMKLALDGVPEKPRKFPEGLVSVRINPETGLRTESANPDAIFEIFRTEYIPEFESASGTNQAGGSAEELFPDDLF